MKFKKLFICFMLFLYICNFAFISNVCASYDVDVDNTIYLLPDVAQDYKDYFIIKYNEYWGGTGTLIICSNYDLSIISNNNNTFTFKCFDNDVNPSSFIYYKSKDNGTYDYSAKSFSTTSGFTGLDVKSGSSQDFVVIFSNSNIFLDNELFFSSSFDRFTAPEIQNKDKISKLDFDSMAIFLNDYDSKERLYLHRLEVATTVDLGDGNTVYYYNDKVFGLDFFTSYYNNDPDHPGYTIPKYQFELENNKIYYFLLSSSATSLDHSYNLIDYTKIENAYDGFGVSTSDSFTYEQLQQEQQKKQNDQLEENNKTNKNIFETIKEMLSYLNPFSENFILLKLWDFLGTLISYINPFSDNFLGKKIVELIGNLLKSLFVPSDEYFNNFFSDLKQWFSDRFGLLFYPFELIIDILNRITNINLSEPKFNIPEIKEPSTGKILFKAQDYNFNDLLDTKEFKIMHDIYFVIVDAIIIFALANLIKSKLKEVETE